MTATYLQKTYRGTEYTLRRFRGGFELTTRRLALGRWNIGGCKFFGSLAEVQSGCRAFTGIELMAAL